jgi:hypothetical protein
LKGEGEQRKENGFDQAGLFDFVMQHEGLYETFDHKLVQ